MHSPWIESNCGDLDGAISAKAFIDGAIAWGGRVLVHCNGIYRPSPCDIDDSLHAMLSYAGGISLSPAFVVMFVMQHHQLTWEDALHMVQNRRYCISPNGGFLTQIKVSLVPTVAL